MNGRHFRQNSLLARLLRGHASENRRAPRFLSERVKLLFIGLGLACLLLIIPYIASVLRGAPLWPLAAALALLALLYAAFFVGVARPYRRLERMIALFAEGYTLPGVTNDDGIHLSPATRQLIDRVGEAFSAASLLKLSKRQAQYRVLQSQINPHFLYNTLESIRSEALIAGLGSVADMTEALAVFFRYTISKAETLVSVEEELENCETYFRIQQYRFGERLRLHIECDAEDREEIYRCRLPKLTLQPILENSIIHGTEFKIGAGNLTVRLQRTESRLLIQVSDDGVGMEEATLARLNERLGTSGRALPEEGGQDGGIALANVNNRIHLIFGAEYGLHVYSMPGLGTDVNIALPIITSDRDILENGRIPEDIA